jgi:hypothetical protein
MCNQANPNVDQLKQQSQDFQSRVWLFLARDSEMSDIVRRGIIGPP